SISMDTGVYEYLNRLTLKDYGATFEELSNHYFAWIVACPEDFQAWVEQNMMERGTDNDN
ncbi:MAG: hypothetical protein K6F84_01460, partial [Lachnospiraceae bacterium]|nr:hypothetical protein [Lachnospiraceae bacterium]